MEISWHEYFRWEMLESLGAPFVGAFFTFLFLGGSLRLMVYVIRQKLMRWAERTEWVWDDCLVTLFGRVSVFFWWSLALLCSAVWWDLAEPIQNTLWAVMIVLLASQVLYVWKAVLDCWEEDCQKKSRSFVITPTTRNALRICLSVVVWGIATLWVLDKLGFNITALVASLGIGGIAAALAAQNLLGDFLSSLSIYLDRPFEVSDYIVIGDSYEGTVKRIGFHTTRLSSLRGEELIIPNNLITNNQIKNFGRLKKRGVFLNLGVEFGTPVAKIKKMLKEVPKIIKNTDKTEFVRFYFRKIGDFSLEFQALYYVKSSEYVDYLEVEQSINLALIETFEKEGIEFAFPTQTLMMRPDGDFSALKKTA